MSNWYLTISLYSIYLEQ